MFEQGLSPTFQLVAWAPITHEHPNRELIEPDAFIPREPRKPMKGNNIQAIE
jgi:hypothetical protein